MKPASKHKPASQMHKRKTHTKSCM